MGALVTSQRGSVFTDELKAAGVHIDDATDDNDVNLRKMLGGHGRFVYMNELTLQHYLHSEGLASRVRVLPVVLGALPAYFWVSRKADPALAGLLGAALGQLKADGELDRIFARWAAAPQAGASSLSPAMPHTMKPIDSKRRAPAGSPSTSIPNTAVPTVPMPVHTA